MTSILSDKLWRANSPNIFSVGVVHLSLKTVIKGFESLGFEQTDNGVSYWKEHNGTTMHIKFGCVGDHIKVEDAQWIKKRNVHIVSFWQYPQNTKELKVLLQGIKETYSELSGASFRYATPFAYIRKA